MTYALFMQTTCVLRAPRGNCASSWEKCRKVGRKINSLFSSLIALLLMATTERYTVVFFQSSILINYRQDKLRFPNNLRLVRDLWFLEFTHLKFCNAQIHVKPFPIAINILSLCSPSVFYYYFFSKCQIFWYRKSASVRLDRWDGTVIWIEQTTWLERKNINILS